MDSISAANLPDMFKLEKPEDVIEAYPKMAWEVLKTLHDENEKLKYQLEKLKYQLKVAQEMGRLLDKKYEDYKASRQ